MGAFALILHAPGSMAREAELDRSLAAIDALGRAGRRCLALGELALGVQYAGLAGECASPLESGDLVLAADARIDNRDELIAQLDVAAHADDAELILAAYRRWGGDCARRLLGDFAFAIYDRSRRALYAAADLVGCRRLFYAELPGDRLLLASEEACLIAWPDLCRDWDRLGLAGWLLADSPRDRSLWSDIQVLAPGSWMRCSHGRVQTQAYWSLDGLAAIRYKDERDYAEALRERLSDAVAVRLQRPAGGVAAELSSGLDSSSVCALASRIEPGGAIKALSQVFPDHRDCDESAGIAAIVDVLGLDQRGFDAGVIVSAGFPGDYVPLSGSPGLLGNPVQRRTLALAGEQGASLLLTGLGGDELTVGAPLRVHLERLLAGDLGVLSEMTRVARRWRVRPWWLALQWFAWPVLERLSPSLVERLRRWRAGCADKDWLRIDAETQRALQRERRRAGSCAVAAMLESVRRSASLRVLDGYRWYGAEVGIDVRAPFLDRRLLEFALAIPPRLWFREGWSKWLLRQAMAGLLPEQTLAGNKVIFGNLFRDAWLANQTPVRTALGASGLKRIPWLDASDILARIHREAPLALDDRRLFFLWSLGAWMERHGGDWPDSGNHP